LIVPIIEIEPNLKTYKKINNLLAKIRKDFDLKRSVATKFPPSYTSRKKYFTIYCLNPNEKLLFTIGKIFK